MDEDGVLKVNDVRPPDEAIKIAHCHSEATRANWQFPNFIGKAYGAKDFMVWAREEGVPMPDKIDTLEQRQAVIDMTKAFVKARDRKTTMQTSIEQRESTSNVPA